MAEENHTYVNQHVPDGIPEYEVPATNVTVTAENVYLSLDGVDGATEEDAEEDAEEDVYDQIQEGEVELPKRVPLESPTCVERAGRRPIVVVAIVLALIALVSVVVLTVMFVNIEDNPPNERPSTAVHKEHGSITEGHITGVTTMAATTMDTNTTTTTTPTTGTTTTSTPTTATPTTTTPTTGTTATTTPTRATHTTAAPTTKGTTTEGPDRRNLTEEFRQYVICDDPSPDVRLVGGTHWAEGRVQIRMNGTTEFYEVCDQGWYRANAEVICRMMCWDPVNTRAHPGPFFGVATLGVNVYDVTCAGTENTLDECEHTIGVPATGCGVNQAAGVSCIPRDYGEPGAAPLVDQVLCENNHITTVFLRDNHPNLLIIDLSVYGSPWLPGACNPDPYANFSAVILGIPFDSCDTILETNTTHITYMNTIVYSVDTGTPPITRTYVYNLPVSCTFARQGNNSIDPIEPINPTAPPQLGTGNFQTRMRLFDDNSFQMPITTFPLEIDLGSFMFVGVNLITSDNLRLTVPHCWATPDIDPASTPNWFLIQDMCRADPSVTFYPMNSTMSAFSFQYFRFLGDYPFLYLHCDTCVCIPGETVGYCGATCAAMTAILRLSAVQESGEGVEVAQGPLFFAEYTPDEDDLRDAPIPEDHPEQSSTTTTTTTTTIRPPEVFD